MHVRWIELFGFRNLASLTFAPDPGLNVLIGANGQGKTSLLEALHACLTGRSFRTSRLAECLGWDAGVGGRGRRGGARGPRSAASDSSSGAREGGRGARGRSCPWAGA